MDRHRQPDFLDQLVSGTVPCNWRNMRSATTARPVCVYLTQSGYDHLDLHAINLDRPPTGNSPVTIPVTIFNTGLPSRAAD